MKRYNVVVHSLSGSSHREVEDPNGKYVRYENVDQTLELLTKIRELVESQAEDIGLWCQPETATEDYIQRALRKLHGAIERENMTWFGIPTIEDK